MAKMEYRKPIDTLLKEKNEIDKKLTSFNDEFDRWHTRLQEVRSEQNSFREGKEALPNSNSSKPAKKVFDDNIATCQKEIQNCQEELEKVEKNRFVWKQKVKAIEGSIKALQNA